MPGPATLAHRQGSATVLVRDAEGRPLPHARVEIAQTRHEFSFGNIGFDFDDLAAGRATAADEGLAALWLDLFDTATLPFYWGDFEPTEGEPRTERLRTTAKWFAERGVRLKGHPLVWHTVQPPWLLRHDLDTVERTQRARIRRDVADFAGLIDTWDAINEVVIMPVFDREDNAVTRLALDRGRIHMVRMAFEEAKAANPEATLLINDFDLSSAYEILLEGLLEADVPIDAVGLQTHMHQGFRGEEEILATVERFARFGLPIHMTETSLVSGSLMPPDIEDLNDYRVDTWPSTPEGEARQADELVRHYRALVGHPAVESITYWGITDRGAWLGAPIGLVRADGSPKPSYAALHDLVKREWWAQPQTVQADADGQVEIAGFRGTYVARSGGISVEVTVGAVRDPQPVVLRVR
ncbi:endo-1,4-beta-xylanase [Microbacterium sp.]|uniref:endo-1,4-beta-xylanase n=1 Tax=Microbacterium sp. TaxID=51671 RepID=UPI002E2FBFAC|nr:endo-1,4-beta-xylanase [Microbacterium sp.]HEX5729293.1 endo-1,4-beta-xylanase [Microbacterium sp.]